MYYYLGTFSPTLKTRVQIFTSADAAWRAALALPPTQSFPLTRERALSWLLQGSDHEKAEDMLATAEQQTLHD